MIENKLFSIPSPIQTAMLIKDVNSVFDPTLLHPLSAGDNYLRTFRISEKNRDKFDKQTALHSVKLLRICNDINAELRAREKVLVLIRVIEFVLSYDHLTEQELAYVDAVGESFNLKHEEYTTIFDFVMADKKVILDKSNLIYLSPKQTNRWSKAKEIVVSGLDDFIGVLYVKSSNTLFFRYLGNQEITLNGQVVANDRLHILNQGSSFKSQKSRTIYHSDIISHF